MIEKGGHAGHLYNEEKIDCLTKLICIITQTNIETNIYIYLIIKLSIQSLSLCRKNAKCMYKIEMASNKCVVLLCTRILLVKGHALKGKELYTKIRVSKPVLG